MHTTHFNGNLRGGGCLPTGVYTPGPRGRQPPRTQKQTPSCKRVQNIIFRVAIIIELSFSFQ